MAKDERGHGSEKRGGKDKTRSALRSATVKMATARAIKGAPVPGFNNAGRSAIRQVRQEKIDRKISHLQKQISSLKQQKRSPHI